MKASYKTEERKIALNYIIDNNSSDSESESAPLSIRKVRSHSNTTTKKARRSKETTEFVGELPDKRLSQKLSEVRVLLDDVDRK